MSSFYKGLLCVLAIGLISPSFASGASEGVYASFNVGQSKAKSIKNSQLSILNTVGYAGIVPNDPEFGVDFKRGINYRGSIGYKVTNFRGELELSYLRAKYKNFTENYGNNPLLFSTDLSGHVDAIPLMLNAYFDWDGLNEWVAPFMGVGIGMAHIKNRIELGGQVTVAGGIITPAAPLVGHMTETKLAFQGIAGLLVNIHSKVAATLDYRCFSTSKLKALDKRFQHQSINVGLMYRF